MLFHTAMIILHRPPRHLFGKPGIAESEDVEICYASMQAMLLLLKSYSKFYKYSVLPLDFVHTLSVTAGTILMKRFLDDAPKDDKDIAKSMHIVLDAMDKIKYTWPCIVEIRESIVQAMETRAADQPEQGPDPVFDFGDFGVLADFSAGSGSGTGVGVDGADLQILYADLGLVPNNDFASDRVLWDNQGPGSDEDLGLVAIDDFVPEQILWDDQGTGSDEDL
jgi:hypothetical protein